MAVADILPDRLRGKAGILLDHLRVKAGILLDHLRLKAGILLGHLRLKAQVGILPDHQAAVGALRHHPQVVAMKGGTVVSKAATAVKTTSSRTVNRNLSPVAGNGADSRPQQRSGDDRNIKGFASPAPHVLKIRLRDRAPVFADV